MTVMPTRSDIRAPKTVWVNTSRPRSSVPNRWLEDGSWSRSAGLTKLDSNGVMIGAHTPSNAVTARKTRLMTTAGFSRSTRTQKYRDEREIEEMRQEPVAGTTARRSARAVSASAMANSRVDEDVQNIDDQHDKHFDRR